MRFRASKRMVPVSVKSQAPATVDSTPQGEVGAPKLATPDKAKRPIAAILKYLTLVHDEILEKYPAGQLPPVDMITFRTADELAPFMKEPLSEGWKSVHELPKIGVFDKF